jgi:uroporphyrinogen III methyltransferase/synthase
MTTAEGPLHGYTILLTRPAASGAELCEKLERLGAAVEMRPTIALEPPLDREPAHRACAAIESFDWLLFTSPRGVHYFFSMMLELQDALPEIKARIGSVGPSTSQTLRERGLPPDVEALESRAEGLASALAGQIFPGQKILVVRPEICRPHLATRLRAEGADVDSVAFYRNVPAPGLDEILRDIYDGRYDVIILTSPSTLERILERAEQAGMEIGKALLGCALVTIGGVTARAVEQAGQRVAAVARRPTAAGISEAVLRLFER